MDQREKLEFLKRALPFATELSERAQDEFARRFLIKDYESGALVSDGGPGMIVLVSGVLKAMLTGRGGRRLLLFRLEPGGLCLVSMNCAFHELSGTMTLEAERDSRVLLLPQSDLDVLRAAYPALESFSAALMARRLSRVLEAMETHLFSSLDRRLAIFLLEQTRLSGSEELKLTHEAAAEALGSAREVVSRTLKSLALRGLVKTSRGSVKIVDAEGLKRLAE